MKCYFKGKVKTNADTISVDFIEVVKNGKTIVLDWDESEIGFDDIPDGEGYRPFSGRLKGSQLPRPTTNVLEVGACKSSS